MTVLNVQDSVNFGSINTVQIGYKAQNNSVFDLVLILTLKDQGRKFFSLNTSVAPADQIVSQSIVQSTSNTITLKINKSDNIQKIQFFCLQLNERPVDGEILFNFDNKTSLTLPIHSIQLAEMGFLEFAQIEFKKISNTMTALRNALQYSEFSNLYFVQQHNFQQPQPQPNQQQQSTVQQQAMRQPAQRREQPVQQQQNELREIQFDQEMLQEKLSAFYKRLPTDSEYLELSDFRFSSRSVMSQGVTINFPIYNRTTKFFVDFLCPQHLLCELGVCLLKKDGTEEVYLGSPVGGGNYGSFEKYPYCLLIASDRSIYVNETQRAEPIRQAVINVQMFTDVQSVILFALNQTAPIFWGLDGINFRIISDGPDIPMTYYPNRSLRSAIFKIGSIQYVDNDWMYIPNIKPCNEFKELLTD